MEWELLVQKLVGKNQSDDLIIKAVKKKYSRIWEKSVRKYITVLKDKGFSSSGKERHTCYI